MKWLKYPLAFVVIAGLLFLSLILVAMIPRSAIQAQIEASAGYLNINPRNFVYVVEGAECSRIDQYADSVLLNVAYFFESDHPVESVLWANYYERDYEPQPRDLLAAVKGDGAANTQYLRYWHGSIVPVRLFHLIGDIHGLYVFHGVLISVLLLWILILLFRHGLKIEAVALIISMIAVNLWFVPLCLDYTWMFLVCLTASIIAVCLSLRGKDPGLLFLITGIVAAFLDFLTTETITLVIPLLLSLRIGMRQGEAHPWQKVTQCCILWGIGFVGMWTLKWGLAAAILRINVLPYLESSFEYHLHIESDMTPLRFALDSIMRNVNNLFPIGYGIVGKVAVLLGLVAVIVLIYRNSISMRENINNCAVALYLLLGTVPYIRYVAIRFHAWYHYFFTYRAQAATVMALCFAIAEVVRVNRKPTHTEPMPVSAE